MSQDLNDLLDGWPHEPGQIKVRKIMGSDGQEKVQLRLDLGLIQMEMQGRPDGQRPHGHESLLHYHLHRAAKAGPDGEKYELSAEECGEMQQEGIQYYHRYLSLFQMEDFPAVARDTERNLEMFAFVREHSDREDIIWAFDQFIPYVQMMKTRALASIELEKKRVEAALKEIDRGKELIVAFYNEHEQAEAAEKSAELSFLDEWSEELRSKRPISKLEKMRREMEMAVQQEAYERAAQLRDQIKALDAKRASRKQEADKGSEG